MRSKNLRAEGFASRKSALAMTIWSLTEKPRLPMPSTVVLAPTSPSGSSVVSTLSQLTSSPGRSTADTQSGVQV